MREISFLIFVFIKFKKIGIFITIHWVIIASTNANYFVNKYDAKFLRIPKNFVQKFRVF